MASSVFAASLATLLLLIYLVKTVECGLKDWRNCPLSSRRYFPASHSYSSAAAPVLTGRESTRTKANAWNTTNTTPRPIRQGYGHNLRKVGFTLEDLYVNRDDVAFGHNITWGFRVRLDEDLTKGTLVKLDIYREMTLFGLFPLVFRIPCVQGFGSCVYDVCQELSVNERVCGYMARNSEPCGCPVKGKTYEVYHDSLVLPMIQGAGAQMINVSNL